jgi:hypothetical protein
MYNSIYFRCPENNGIGLVIINNFSVLVCNENFYVDNSQKENKVVSKYELYINIIFSLTFIIWFCILAFCCKSEENERTRIRRAAAAYNSMSSV